MISNARQSRRCFMAATLVISALFAGAVIADEGAVTRTRLRFRYPQAPFN